MLLFFPAHTIKQISQNGYTNITPEPEFILEFYKSRPIDFLPQNRLLDFFSLWSTFVTVVPYVNLKRPKATSFRDTELCQASLKTSVSKLN